MYAVCLKFERGEFSQFQAHYFQYIKRYIFFRIQEVKYRPEHPKYLG